MKTLSILITVSLTFLGSTLAQEPKEIEVFSGFHYNRHQPVELNTFGWNVSLEASVNEWFAITAATSGTYGNVADVGVSAYSFTTGPQVNVRMDNGKGFLRFAVGGLHGSAAEVTATEMIAVLWGGVDLDISERLAFRVLDVSYSYRLSGGSVDSIRMSAGPVLRF